MFVGSTPTQDIINAHVVQLADTLSSADRSIGSSNLLMGTLSGCGAIGSARDLGETARAVPQFYIGVLRSW